MSEKMGTFDFVENNTNCIIQVYGNNSFIINDEEDLIEYAETSDNDDQILSGSESNEIRNEDQTFNENVENNTNCIIQVHESQHLADDEDLIEYAEWSDNDELVDQIVTGDDGNGNRKESLTTYGVVENNTNCIIQVYGNNSFTINEEDLIEYAELSDNEDKDQNSDDFVGDIDLDGRGTSTDEIDDVIDETADIGVIYQGRPKKGRKLKIPGQSRADRKKLYNTNKKHVNTKGNVVDEKTFNENFICRCSKNCTNVVSLEQRKRLFNQFWSMGSFSGRCVILISCVSQGPKKRSYSKRPMKNRRVSRKYTMFGHNVCKVALLRTLQINHKRISVALTKQVFFDTFADCRGKASGGANTFTLSKIMEVRAHISSFPKYISHYTRSQTNSKFLNSNLNLAKMFALYKSEAENPVSKSFYKRVFYDDFNLRFKKPKKDTCLRCDIYLKKIRSPLLKESERLIIEEWHQEHLEQAELLRTQMYRDLAMAKIDPSLEAFTFDFQKILSVPKLTTSIVYYKRQLNLYNFGVHVGSTGKGNFNVWIETEASKGTQEVGSCLKKHISTINGPKTLILWSDACGGQNRSIKLVLMLIHILQNHQTLETISVRYLQTGHSFLPNDSEFGDFECSLKVAGPVYTDAAVIDLMENCRIENKFIVNRMSSQDFFSVKSLENEITNRKIDLNKNKINWLETHEIVIEKANPGIIKMRKKLDGAFQFVNIEKRNGDLSNIVAIELDALWPNGRPLSKEKLDDLNEILRLVPDEHRHFYSFLRTAQVGNFVDDIDGFGETIDFEVEE